MLIPPVENGLMRTFKVTHLCTCIRVEYPIIINIEAIRHILVVIHLKRTHTLTLKALRQNLHLTMS